MYQQHYRVGEQTYNNAYAGLYASAQTQHFCENIIPKFHLDRFSAVDVPALGHVTTADLVKRKLCEIRDSHQRIRFHYTGGSDSHTMMLAAQELGMEFENYFLHTNSLLADPSVEYEFVPGMQYLEHLGVDHIVHRPRIEDFERVWFDPLCYTKYGDFYHGFVPWYSDLFLQYYDTDYFNLLGVDKPFYYIDPQGNYYWLIRDDYDYCMNTEHEDFFLGSVCAELTVKQVYRGYEYAQTRNAKPGFLVYKDWDQIDYFNHLGLDQGIDCKFQNAKTKQHWQNTGYFNEKHRRAMLQVLELGRKDIVDAWINTSAGLVETLKPAPWGIDVHSVNIPELDNTVTLSTNIARIGAIFRITPERLELLPHCDIGRLTNS